MQYSYLMKKPYTQAPEVTATSSDPKVVVEAVQATGVPGTATISLVDYITYDKKELCGKFWCSFGFR
jgi:beta-glucosidase